MILDKRADLGHGDVKKLLFSLSVPTITSQIVNMLYNLVDRVFIGHMQPAETVGKLALTGVGVCLPIIMVISAFASLMAIGGAPRASIAEGAGESEKSERIMGNCLTMLVITALVLTVLFESFAEPLLLMFGASENTIGYALDYMRIYALGTIFVQLTLGMNAYITAQGFATVSMKTVLIGALLNTALDPLFIFVLGLGVRGAALATAVSPVLSIAICSRHFFKKSSTVRLVRQLPSPKLLAQSCQLGVSGFVGEMSSGVTTTVFNLLLLRLAGNVAVAAYGVVANYALVATAIFNGVAQGAQPLVSRCYGKNDAAGARKLLLLGSGTALALAAALYAVLFGFTGPIVAVFNSENSALMAQYAFSGVRIYFLGYFFAGFNIVAAGYLGAVDRPAEASATSLSRGIVAIVACSLVLSALFGMNGVWAAFPASEAITACLTLFLLKRKKRTA